MPLRQDAREQVHIGAGDTVLDVGANVGLFTLLAAQVQPVLPYLANNHIVKSEALQASLPKS